MTTPPLSLLADLARAATPGPWHVEVDEKPRHDGTPRVMCIHGPVSIVDHGLGPERDCVVIAETDGGQYGPRYADAAYIAAASPSIVLELVERVRELERERDRHAAGAEEYRAELGAIKDVLGLSGGGIGLSVHEHIRLQAARIAELEAGLREACEIADEWITEAGASPGWGAGDRGEHARVARLRALLTP